MTGWRKTNELGVWMKEDRSWVLPLAFAVFAGVLVVATLAILSAQDLLLGPKAAALAGWLTLVVTAAGFSVTIFIVAMTANQVRDSQKQTTFQVFKIINESVDEIKFVQKHLRTILLQAKYVDAMYMNDDFGLEHLDFDELQKDAYLAHVELSGRIQSDKYGVLTFDEDFGKGIEHILFELILVACPNTLRAIVKQEEEDGLKKLYNNFKAHFETVRNYEDLLERTKLTLERRSKGLIQTEFEPAIGK